VYLKGSAAVKSGSMWYWMWGRDGSIDRKSGLVPCLGCREAMRIPVSLRAIHPAVGRDLMKELASVAFRDRKYRRSQAAGGRFRRICPE